ncbi:MAG: glycosyltransferase family 4 protein [Lewinellaceae bacterium]|nr:glycosyltransferase family 4 protein [Lewinellaceae bacterium]
MKVLFVVSGNNAYYDVAPFIKSQGDSLEQAGVEVSYFLIKGKGLFNYIKNVGPLKKHLKEHPADILHAHYSLCGWVAVLAAGGIPVVLSFMGDDVFGAHTAQDKRNLKSWLLTWLGRAVQPFVQAIICKSEGMMGAVYRKNISYLIPNGVRLEQFNVNPAGYREELGIDPHKKQVLFLGNPSDMNKNIALVESALDLLNLPDVELLVRYKVSHDLVVKYLNSADVFVLCSFSEGSPNVVKEAMACNCPMVVTNVGDAAQVVAQTPGCFVSASFQPEDFAEKLKLALLFAEQNGRTNGRADLATLGLDAESIAQRVVSVYDKVMNKPVYINQQSFENIN